MSNAQNSNNLCTNRQEQIERITDILGQYTGYSSIVIKDGMDRLNMRDLAIELVDNGIGDKDRFEVAPPLKPTDQFPFCVQPKHYKENDNENRN